MAVYQETNKNKITKDGRKWFFRLYYVDMYGNRKQKWSKLYMTKGEAKDAESKFRISIRTHDETNLSISFKEVYEEWLNYKETLVKYTTFHSYELNMENHVLKYFSKFKLHSIKADNITRWRDELYKKKLTEKFKNRIIGTFKDILEYARINYNFDPKVVSKLQTFRMSHISYTKNDSLNNYWTPEEFQTFIKTVEDDYFKMLYMFLYYTGLRLGELTALTWDKVDFNRKTVVINANLTRSKKGGKEKTDPKSVNSERIIILDDELFSLIQKHYDEQKKIDHFTDTMYVFGSTKYSAIRYTGYTTIRTHLTNDIKKANVKNISPHGFRHSHVSLLVDLGCDFREVAERIGDTVTVVEKTYYHMFPYKRKGVINKLNDYKKSIKES